MLAGIRFRLEQLRRRIVPETYEPDVAATIRRIVRPGDTCLDVGANVGALTRPLATAVGPGGRVIAYEAYPPTAEALRESLAAEGLGWVTVENVAVTDGGERTVWLYPGRNRWNGEWNIVGHDVEGRETAPEVEVTAVSLDDYLAAAERVDFVKIDVEGAEGRVLKGMQRLLRQARPFVLVEFHDDEGWAGRRYLLDAGYGLETLRGQPIPPNAGRVYHCLARPSEHSS
jgi:FkbM family methyltransferase